MNRRSSSLRIKKRALEKEKVDLKDPRYDFGTAMQTVLHFMENPSKLWNSEEFEDKRTMLKLTVLGVLPYDPQIGFGTARFPLLFELCKVAESDKKVMVETVRKSWNRLEETILQWHEQLKGRKIA